MNDALSAPRAVRTALTPRRVATLSIAAAVVLIAMKAFALGASGSVSMLASLVDSALDLAASLVAVYAVRWAARPDDPAPRRAHGEGEALAALVQCGLILASAVFIGWEALTRIFDPRPVTGGLWVVGVAIVSMIVTAGLIVLQTRVPEGRTAPALASDRARHVADLAAGAVVLIGAASGALLGAPGLDAAAGLVVAVWLAWGAVGLATDAGGQLLDREASDADRRVLSAAVLSDPRVGGVHHLRTRLSGGRLTAQMRIDLDRSLSFEDAHAIVVEAEARIRAAFPEADVLIHADPRGPWHPAAPAAPAPSA